MGSATPQTLLVREAPKLHVVLKPYPLRHGVLQTPYYQVVVRHDEYV
jgi:hypothetical protein